jgi:hypothetical protein
MPATIRRAVDPCRWAAVVALLVGLPAFGQPTKSGPIPVTIPVPGGPVVRVPIPRPTPSPDAVLLTPARYRELLDQIEKLQAQLAARQPHRPRACELDGRIEQRGQQGVVRFKATFKYTAPEPNAVIFLGCQKAHVIEAKLDDGKVPLLTAADDGLRVQAETAGEHVLRLELDVALTPRNQKGDPGFEMGLPGAPITALTFEPPAGVRRLTVTTRVPKPAGVIGPDQDVEQAETERFQPGKGGVPLGPITSLGLSWEDPQKKSAVVRSAEADIVVTVGPDEVVTEAKLRLRGGAADWKFTAPASADVAVSPWLGPAAAKAPAELPPDRAPVVTRPEPGQSVWGLRFRDPPTGDLLVTVTTRAARPKTGPIPVGPFAVLDAPHQVGTIRLRTPLGWKANAALKGDTRREPDGAVGEAVYRYALAAPLKTPIPDPPLTFTLAASPGVVTARTRTELRLAETGWGLRAEVSVAPSRAEVEVIEFETPARFTPTRAEPREIVEGLSAVRDLSDGRRVFQVRLVSPKRAAFAFTIEGDYAGPIAENRATLFLPRLLNVTERAAELVVTTPSRFDVSGTFRVWEGTKPGNWEAPLEIEPSDKESRVRGAADKPIAAAHLSWPAASGGVAVQSTADVSLENSWTRVTQRLSYTFTGRPPARLRLTADRPVGAVRSSRGAVERVAEGWEVVVPADAGRGLDVVLTYAVRGPSPTLPVLVPETPDSVQTLRLWESTGRSLTAVPSAEWAEAPIEVVADRPTLPGLVLRARGPVAPPAVQVGPVPADLPAGPTVLRAAIDVRAVGEVALCRARFWVSAWGRDPEMLIPSEARGTEILLSGKRVVGVEAGGEDVLRGLRLPVAPGSPGGVVEVRYRLSWRPEVSFQHPGFARADLVGDITWTVTPPPGRVPLVVGDTTADWTPAAFLATLGLGRFNQPPGGPESDGGPVVLTQRERTPVRLVLVPRHVWVLACSAVAFAVVASLVACPARHRRWLGVAGLIGLTALAIWFPQPLSRTAFGMVPGLLAVAVTLLAFRAVRTRYRARAARSPGFAKSGSTPGRPSSIRGRGPTTAPIAPVPSGSWSGQ